MKYPPFSLLAVAIPLGLLANSGAAQDKPDLTDHNRKINYALGQDIVSTFRQQDVEIDLQAFAAGMTDALAGRPALTPDQQKAALKELADEVTAKEEARRKIAAVKNLAEGQAFLAANAKKKGVKIKEVTAPDGTKAELQYEILKSGPDGPSPKKTDTVEVHYVGTRVDGSEFESSIRRNTPATFGVTDVIPGWTAALQMMKAGDKWRLFVPAKLAYREFGLPQIGPNSTLIYEIELLSFFPPKKANSAPAASPTPKTGK